MASIFEKNSILMLRYYDKRRGYTVRISLGMKDTRENRRKANEIKRQFEAELINGKNLKQTNNRTVIKFSDGVKLYLSTRRLVEETIVSYNYAKDLLISAVGDLKVNEYNEEDYLKLVEFLTNKNLVQNSQSIIMRNLNAFFNFFLKKKWIEENIIIRIPVEEKPIKIIKEEELNELLNYIKSKNVKAYGLIKFMAITGIRKGTALKLDWENIKLNEKIIDMPNQKGKRNFIYPISKILEELIKEIGVQKEGRVFNYTKDGLKFWYKYQDGLWKEKRYGLHNLRKTFITGLIDKNYSLYDVAALADHRDIETTRKYYTRLNADRLRMQLDNDEKRDSKRTRNEHKPKAIREKKIVKQAILAENK
jgi:integrase